MCDCGSSCTPLSFSPDSLVSTLRKTRHVSLIVHTCGQICAVLVIQMLWCCLQTIEVVSVKVLLPLGLGFMCATGQIVFYRFCLMRCEAYMLHLHTQEYSFKSVWRDYWLVLLWDLYSVSHEIFKFHSRWKKEILWLIIAYKTIYHMAYVFYDIYGYFSKS